MTKLSVATDVTNHQGDDETHFEAMSSEMGRSSRDRPCSIQ